MDPLNPLSVLGYGLAAIGLMIITGTLVFWLWWLFDQPDTGTAEQPKLYVRAVVPRYALLDFQRSQYSAWYLGHESDTMLESDSLTLLHDRYQELHGGEDDVADGLGDFLDWLEAMHGYTVFYTGGEDGVAIIDVDRDGK